MAGPAWGKTLVTFPSADLTDIIPFLQDSRYFNSLAELYNELNEDDVLCGLWKRRCIAPETRAAVGWMQHGYLDVAQDCILQAMSKHANKTYENGRIPCTDDACD